MKARPEPDPWLGDKDNAGCYGYWMYLSQAIAAFQLLLLLAMVPVVLMAQRTSRRRRSKQKTYFSMAILLTTMSMLGLLWIVLSSAALVTEDDVSYWVALLIPAVMMALCVWITWRALDKHSGRSKDSPSEYRSNRRL